MSRLAREYPDQPDVWANPPMRLPVNHMGRYALENGPDIDEDDALPGDPCETCGGDGGWSYTVEGPDGRDVDIDHDCHACDATGVAL